MDKNSEDEEGQLEEQIERLQEKVESAQSEQKNLFLVIFQVRKTSVYLLNYLSGFKVAALLVPALQLMQLLQVEVNKGFNLL